MELFNRNTTAKDLLKFINWDLRVLDLINSTNSNEKGKITSWYIKLVDNFENEYSNLTSLRQKEFLYAGIRSYREKIFSFEEIETDEPDKSCEFYNEIMFKLPENRLTKKIYNSYSRGENQKIDAFKTEIEQMFNFEIDNNESMIEIECSTLYYDKIDLQNATNHILEDLSKHIFEKVVTIIDFLKYLETKEVGINNSNNIDEIKSTNFDKLKWKGTPSQFGYLIIELIGKGFLERPTNSYKKDAIKYNDVFEIDGTLGTIEKEINEKSNSLSLENGRRFNLPHIDKFK